MTQHLKDMALEAAAHGRDDLLEASERAHLDACAECRGHVAETRVLSNDASLALREALPPMEDLESLIAAALDAAPVAAVRPSTRALLVSAVTAAAATVTLGLLSGASSLPTASSVFATLRDAAAVVGAVDRVVTVAVPGGWSLVLLGGFLVLLAVAVPLRRLAARSAPVPTPGAGAVLGVFALLLSLSLSPWGGVAHALELEGEWPELEASVSLSVERAPVGEVARQAAEAAGLGYAATLPEEVSGREVTLHVRDASLRDVLEAVLGDAPVIARRTGAMLVLSPGASTPPESEPGADPGPDPAAGPSLAVPAVPAVPPVPVVAGNVPAPPPVPETARERVTFGEDVHVRPGERVREVVSMGGDVVVEGEVLRDVVTMGGDLHIKAGGIVHGAMVTMGGEVIIDEGGQHLGESVSMGVPFGSGSLGGPRAGVGGDDDHGGGVRIGGWLEDALGSAAKHALLFLLGIILLGVAPARFGALKRTIAGSPFRSGGIGILGFIASVLLVVVLTITLIGIPAAIVVALGAFLGAYVGLVASAAVVGAVLPWRALKDRPITQLAVGLAIFYVISLLPGIGAVFALIATALGFGALLLTRFAPRAPGEA